MSAEDSKLIKKMDLIIQYVAKTIAVIMVVVIMWGVADIVYVLYQRLTAPPFMLLEIKDILATFGAFMAVLIAIEIYHNLILYAHDSHNSRLAVEIVLGTALMAAARKVIIFDYNEMDYNYVYATGAVILALSIAYYFIVIVPKKKHGLPSNE
tara:strand:+ start:147 stop:605 length:459 start_codon:yes stop_codon:yes gene_type:complete